MMIGWLVLCSQEIEAIKARVKEMEEEAEKLKEMQGEVEKQLMGKPGLIGYVFGYDTGPCIVLCVAQQLVVVFQRRRKRWSQMVAQCT